MKINLCIPCYNCSKQIQRLLNNLIDIELKNIVEIVAINNFSEDDTLDVIKEYKEKIPKLTIINHKSNYGLGGSFKTAYSYCDSKNVDYMIWFHGDYQASVDCLIKMIDFMSDDRVDCYFGSRFMAGSNRFGYSFERVFGNIVFNIIYSIFLGCSIKELGSGLNAYRLKSLCSVDLEHWPNHIAFDANLIFSFYKRNIKWFPIDWYEEDQVSNARNFVVAKDLLKMLLKYFFTRKIDTSKKYYVERKLEFL